MKLFTLLNVICLHFTGLLILIVLLASFSAFSLFLVSCIFLYSLVYRTFLVFKFKLSSNYCSCVSYASPIFSFFCCFSLASLGIFLLLFSGIYCYLCCSQHFQIFSSSLLFVLWPILDFFISWSTVYFHLPRNNINLVVLNIFRFSVFFFLMFSTYSDFQYFSSCCSQHIQIFSIFLVVFLNIFTTSVFFFLLFSTYSQL
jgi:hypothetical protein